MVVQMSGFVGRSGELQTLAALLGEARTGPGVMVAMRGRRQVGKSRLVSEFIDELQVPSVFFTASRQPPRVELAHFVAAATAGGIDGIESIGAESLGSWEAALLLATAAATPERPVVVVIDEFPYLAESEPAIEAILQKVWGTIERRSVLMILIGSDISMMEAATEYGRPLYGRAREIEIQPLTVSDIAKMRSLRPTSAFDAYVMVGGFPRLALRWRRDDTPLSFLRREFTDESSPFVVTGERVLGAELPTELNARAVLTAIGAGERSFATILSRSGVNRGSFERALVALADKRLVRRETPYAEPSTGKLPRYFVADEYLRFWLRFVQPGIEEMARGREDLAVARFVAGWETFRGRAIEPLVRRSLERLLPHPTLGDAAFVGAFWTKDNRVEVDMVGGRHLDRAGSVDFVGSIKWRDRAGFDRNDLANLHAARSRLPGAGPDTRLVGVSRTGFTTAGLDLTLGPEDLLASWDPR